MLSLLLQYKFATPSCLLLAVLMAGNSVFAATLPTKNRSPLVQIYGLPSPVSINNSATTYQLNTALYNINSISSRENEQIILDGESYHADLGVNLHINPRHTIGLSSTYIGHSGGNADHGIEQWHKWFGLPNGERENRPQNKLEYRYLKSGLALLDISTQHNGMGDTNVYWRYKIPPENKPSLLANTSKAIRLGIEAPTGHSSKLTGSRSWDIYADFTIGANALMEWHKIDWQLSSGLLWSSNEGLLKQVRNRTVYYAHGSVAYNLLKNIQAIAQLDFHTSFYDSTLPEIGRNSTQLALGIGGSISENYRFAFYLTEDIEVRTSPDIGIGFELSYRPNIERRD